VFVDRIRDMLLGGNRVLDEALSQALKLEATKAAARLQVVRAGAFKGPWLPQDRMTHMLAL
jgi:hypothetical protein